MNDFRDLLGKFRFIKDNKKVEWCNVPCAFDIESTSFYRRIDNHDIVTLQPSEDEYFDYEKCGVMYAFVIGINGKTYISRAWCAAQIFFLALTIKYKLNKNRKMVFYIHNLQFEMQFFRKLFNWESVFATEPRAPLYCLTDGGIEFRCSYRLTNYSLTKVGEHLLKYKVEKKVGDLDYSLFRNSITPLSDKEKGYIINDGLVVMAHIQEEIERLGDITKLPLTNTGYIRNLCRLNCLYNGDRGHRKFYYDYRHYRYLIENLTLTMNEYKLAKRAFHGGFTHASPLYSGLLVHNVGSYDFSSAYPAVMVMEQFPMSKGKKVKIASPKEAYEYMGKYCCLFDVYLTGVDSKDDYEHFQSISKCFYIENELSDNGRLVKADKIAVSMTEQDFIMFRRCYDFKTIRFGDFYIYRKGYLPTAFVSTILGLYKKKTELKGVADKESEYMHAKSELNSCFGMCVTSIIREVNKYEDGEWITEDGDEKEQLRKYNNSKTRFLSYLWGVWITSYNQANLWTAIREAKDCYVYADTDSVKVRFSERLEPYIRKYNELVDMKMRQACEYHKIPFYMTRPKTIKGVEKPLGYWDYEGEYDDFKTLGAKRYMTRKGDDYSITVAGVNKNTAVPYILSLAKEKNVDPFSLFEDGLEIPDAYAGKLLHTYVDEPREGVLVDYLGNPCKYNEESAVHLEKTSYSLTITENYLEYLDLIQEVVQL